MHKIYLFVCVFTLDSKIVLQKVSFELFHKEIDPSAADETVILPGFVERKRKRKRKRKRERES